MRNDSYVLCFPFCSFPPPQLEYVLHLEVFVLRLPPSKFQFSEETHPAGSKIMRWILFKLKTLIEQAKFTLSYEFWHGTRVKCQYDLYDIKMPFGTLKSLDIRGFQGQ